jgi:hypothetical protein
MQRLTAYSVVVSVTYVDRRPGKNKNVVQVDGWKKIDYL